MFNNLMTDLQHNKEQIDERIKKSEHERYTLLAETEDNTEETLPNDLEDNLRDLMVELYYTSHHYKTNIVNDNLERDFTMTIPDSEKNKLKNMPAANLLSEVESIINNHLELFEEQNKLNPNQMKIWKNKIRDKEKA